MPERPDYASGYARSHRIYEMTGIVIGVSVLALLESAALTRR